MLVSSLSSTPGVRRSGSGRWATGPGGGQALMGRVDLGVDDLSAAHWELAEAERGLEVGHRGWVVVCVGCVCGGGEGTGNAKQGRGLSLYCWQAC